MEGMKTGEVCREMEGKECSQSVYSVMVLQTKGGNRRKS